MEVHQFTMQYEHAKAIHAELEQDHCLELNFPSKKRDVVQNMKNTWQRAQQRSGAAKTATAQQRYAPSTPPAGRAGHSRVVPSADGDASPATMSGRAAGRRGRGALPGKLLGHERGLLVQRGGAVLVAGPQARLRRARPLWEGLRGGAARRGPRAGAPRTRHPARVRSRVDEGASGRSAIV